MGPLVVMVVSFSGQAGGKPAFLLSLMSVFALVSTFTGGMAVAMDITAGERERRSLVPLLLTPITSRHLVLGKWLATCAFALGALAINIAGVAAVMALRAPGSLGGERRAARLVGAPRARAARVLRGGRWNCSRRPRAARRRRPPPGSHSWSSCRCWWGCSSCSIACPANGWLALPVVGQQLIVLRALGGAPAPLIYGVSLALVTAAATIPALAGAARVLSRDQVLAG